MVSKNIIIYLVALVLIIVGAYYLTGGGQQTQEDPDAPKPPQDYEVPQAFVHWHARLNIVIKGEVQAIPADLGISVGNKIDTYLAGGMSPIHTHVGGEDELNDNGRKLHFESTPKSKPSVLSLWYFFKVWGKTFNSNCILDKCNGPDGTVKMFVNDKPNTDFEKYFVRDGDRILIVYE